MMKRKYYSDTLGKYGECEVFDTFDDIKKITEEKVVGLKGESQPWDLNKLFWLTGVDAARQRGERIWQNEKGFWSATPFGKFVE